MRAAVLTVSDGVAAGTRQDASGAVLAERAQGAGFDVVERVVVPDDRSQVAEALWGLTDVADLVLTTGGTGFAPRRDAGGDRRGGRAADAGTGRGDA